MRRILHLVCAVFALAVFTAGCSLSGGEGSVTFRVDGRAAASVREAQSGQGHFLNVSLKGGYEETKTEAVTASGAVVSFAEVPVGAVVYAEAEFYLQAADGIKSVLYSGKTEPVTIVEGENAITLKMTAPSSGGGNGGTGGGDVSEVVEEGTVISYVAPLATLDDLKGKVVNQYDSDGTCNPLAVFNEDGIIDYPSGTEFVNGELRIGSSYYIYKCGGHFYVCPDGSASATYFLIADGNGFSTFAYEDSEGVERKRTFSSPNRFEDLINGTDTRSGTFTNDSGYLELTFSDGSKAYFVCDGIRLRGVDTNYRIE